ncbi:MAG: hypothetical protein ABFS45_05720 [Pseudomonadota bacterium]
MNITRLINTKFSNIGFLVTLSAITAGLLISTTVALADDSIDSKVTSNYFDANWTLSNTNSQPHQPAANAIETIAARYFDENWTLNNSYSKPYEQPSEKVDVANSDY